MSKARKIVAGLLAVYMLTLLFSPCHDCCDIENHHTLITYQSAQEHHDQENDICSPFCSCSCCSTLITVLQVTELKTFTRELSREYPLITQSFLFVFPDDCWQPPRTI